MTNALTEVDPLLELFGKCVVRVDVDGSFAGTGFYVAPCEVLTCAHVVHGGNSVTVGDGWAADPITPLLPTDDTQARKFYPQPDAVLLRVPSAPTGHACVRLADNQPATDDRLQLTAWVKSEHAPASVARSGASLRMETTFEQERWTLYKLREGQVIKGFSGSPVLNRRTGDVCALIDATRAERSDLGGFGVPVAAIATLDSDLLTRNAAFHHTDQRWADAHEAQRVADTVRTEGSFNLPLLAPIVDLDWQPGDPPSELMRPRYAVVPFTSREEVLERIMLWRESAAEIAVLALGGRGGSGKTRTAVEACALGASAGWTAGILNCRPDEVSRLQEFYQWPGRLMIAIDYAETRPIVVSKLLETLILRQRSRKSRIVLIMRGVASRDAALRMFASGDSRDDVSGVLRRAEMVGVESQDIDRDSLFNIARTAFSGRAGNRFGPIPDLQRGPFSSPLMILAAALLSIKNGAGLNNLTGEDLLLEFLDQHEAAYWERSASRHKVFLSRAETEALVALSALFGSNALSATIRSVPSLQQATDVRISRIGAWMSDLYGEDGALEPDLLAEVLIAKVAQDHYGSIRLPFESASESQLVRAMIVLRRAAEWSAPVRKLAREVLSDTLPRRIGSDRSKLSPEFREAVRLLSESTPSVGASFDTSPSAAKPAITGEKAGRQPLRPSSTNPISSSSAVIDYYRTIESEPVRRMSIAEELLEYRAAESSAHDLLHILRRTIYAEKDSNQHDLPIDAGNESNNLFGPWNQR